MSDSRRHPGESPTSSSLLRQHSRQSYLESLDLTERYFIVGSAVARGRVGFSERSPDETRDLPFRPAVTTGSAPNKHVGRKSACAFCRRNSTTIPRFRHASVVPRPIRRIQTQSDGVAKCRERPGGRPRHEPMLDRIEVNVIHVVRIIGIVACGVFPLSMLQNATFPASQQRG
jgi:hypothetical protein